MTAVWGSHMASWTCTSCCHARPCTQADHDEIQAILAEIEVLEGGAKLDMSEEELCRVDKLLDRQFSCGFSLR